MLLAKGGIGGSNKQMPFDKFLLRKSRHIEARKEVSKFAYCRYSGNIFDS